MTTPKKQTPETPYLTMDISKDSRVCAFKDKTEPKDDLALKCPKLVILITKNNNLKDNPPGLPNDLNV
jgi:hypothetical protein